MAFFSLVLGFRYAPAGSAIPRPRACRRRLILGGDAVETVCYPIVTPVHLDNVAKSPMEHVTTVILSRSTPTCYDLTVAGQCASKVFSRDIPGTANLVRRYAHAADMDSAVPLSATPVPVIGVGVSALFLAERRDRFG